MSSGVPCPRVEDWHGFVLGQVSTSAMEALEQHLASCPQCVEVLDALPGHDTLVEALRGQEAVEPEAADGSIRAMIQRMEELPLPLAGPDGSDPGPEQTPGPSTTVEEMLAFLAPAQESGEIGRLNGYRLLRVVGAGGMGIVFEAEDLHLHRRVALKVMRPALAPNATARQRFLREARLAAAIEHEHVIHILQVGEDCGILFVAMPLLQGESLDDRLQREGTLPVAEILRIGREMAEGLAAAHEHGLVHRDIKPTNVWLEAFAGEPGASALGGRVKLLDFGLAWTPQEDTRLTQTGVIVGTPAYMAPEQARNQPTDARADLFSLGCVLYRMATKRLPFPGTSTMQILSALALDQPADPRVFNPALPPALAKLVLRLLAKLPQDRPPSARAVVDAIRVIDRRELVPATRKTFPRRALTVGVALAVLSLTVASYLAAPRLPRKDPVERGDEESLPETIVPGEPLWIWKQELGRVNAVAFSPDGTRLAAAGGAGVKVWDVRTGREAVLLRARDGKSRAYASVAYSPDGKRLAGGTTNSLAEIWDANTGEEILRKDFGIVGEEIQAVAFSPDGKQIASPTGRWSGPAPQDVTGRLMVWDAATGKDRLLFQGHIGGVAHAVFSPNGHLLASASAADYDWNHGVMRHGEVKIWDAATGQIVHDLQRHTAGVNRVAFSPDGQRLASASWDETLRVWDVTTGREALTLRGHDAVVWCVVFSPDGRHLASSASGGAIRLWDAQTGRKIGILGTHSGHATCVAFSPDGKCLASGAIDDNVKLWDLTSLP